MHANVNSGIAKVYDRSRFLAEVLYELQFSLDAETGLTSVTGVIDVLRGEQFFKLDSILHLEIEDRRIFEVTVGWKDEWTGRYYVRGTELKGKAPNASQVLLSKPSAELPGNSIIY
jgi:hypothetical protein